MILSADSKKVMMQALAVKLNAATTAAINIYDGASLLATVTLPSSVIAPVTGGTITFKAIEPALISLTGTPDVAKIVLDGVVAIDLAVGFELVLSDTTIYKGGYLKITALSINI